MPPLPVQLVVVDTETTGLDPVRDRVIDIGAVRLDADLQVTGFWSTLVDPQRALPLQITRLTGIAQSDLEGAPSFAQAYRELGEFAGEALFVGQNVAFDIAMLAAAAARCGAPPPPTRTFDTLEASLLLYPECDRHGLGSMAATLGLGEPPHRALPDAQVTAALLRALRRRAADLSTDERRLLEAAAWAPLRLLDTLGSGDEPGNEPGGLTTPASATGAAGTGPVPPDGRPALLPCAPDDWRAAFAAGGALAGALEGFAVRPGQVDLAGEVAALLDSGGLGLFEAGTGMGKSLAYLLPAAFRAASCGARVTVSTKTKALQRQLAERELPLVASCLPTGFRWTLLMGRENYLCRRRLDEAVAGTGGGLPDRDRLLALAWLAGRARRGEVDVSALPYGATQTLPALAETAHELRASATACLGGRCRSRTGCFWRLARSAARAAHLVCVNHALLLTGGDTLPPFDDLVVDEAHLLPDEAVSIFSERADRGSVDELLGELRGRHGRRPLATAARAAAGKVADDAAAALVAAADGFEQAARTVPGLADDLGGALEALVVAAAEPDADPAAAELYGRTLLLTAGLQEQSVFDTFATVCGALAAALSDLAQAASAAAEALPEEHRERPRAVAVGADAAAAARLLTEVTRTPPADLVFWAELVGRGGGRASRRLTAARAWSLNRAPLSPAALVRERLWDRLRSGVLVSATLAVAGSFAYYRGEAGLVAELDVRERVFASPFDYRRQAALVLEHDPDTRYDAGAQPARLAERLRRLTELTGGRLLALFTNKREVEAVAELIGPHVEDEGVVLLAQGVHGGAAALAEEFRSHPATVLLGVDALWTGQDFPGDALVCLVIARLPFPRQDARFQARRQAAQDEGRDWFRGFYLPEAVLRFRQGFGRLVRTETDAGVVVVLDHRLTQKTYQREFLASLPEIEIVRAAPEALPAAVAAALTRLGIAGRPTAAR